MIFWRQKCKRVAAKETLDLTTRTWFETEL
jgi:hypothetical protein